MTYGRMRIFAYSHRRLAVFSFQHPPVSTGAMDDAHESTGNEQNKEYLACQHSRNTDNYLQLLTKAATIAQSSNPKLLTRNARV